MPALKFNRKIPDGLRIKILDTVARLLDQEDISITLSRGVKWFDDYATGTRRAEATKGETFTIEVNGGAQEIEETTEEKLARLTKEEKP